MTGNATVALLTVAWGLLATATSPRLAIAAAGVLLLLTPTLMPWRRGRSPGGRRHTRTGVRSAGSGRTVDA